MADAQRVAGFAISAARNALVSVVDIMEEIFGSEDKFQEFPSGILGLFGLRKFGRSLGWWKYVAIFLAFEVGVYLLTWVLTLEVYFMGAKIDGLGANELLQQAREQKDPDARDTVDSYKCNACGYTYVTTEPTTELPETFCCPLCGSGRDCFAPSEI